MKITDIFEDIDIDYVTVYQWIKDNCYTYEGNAIDDIELKRFSVGETNGKVYISTIENFKIITDADTLPYKLRACSQFTLEARNLKDCSQFPEFFRLSVVDIALYKCHVLDFSSFPTLYKRPLELHINNINDISMSRIFANKNLFVSKLSILNCFNSDLYDCEKWDDIKVKVMYLECQNKLRNFTHIFNIPQSKLKMLRFKYGNDSYYDEGILDDLNRLIRMYREDRHNSEDYVMDATLALIDLGLEDII